MHVVIAGAGVGGLTAALSLHDGGFDRVEALEVTPVLRPVGAGVNLLPNAVRELAALGLYHELAERAAHTTEVRYHDSRGEVVLREPRGRTAGCRWPQLSLRRGDLQTALVDAVRTRLGEDALRVGTRVTGLRQEPGGVRVHTAVGDREEHLDADVLVGADGLHSAVRRAVTGHDAEPVWNGVVVWRGMVWAPPPKPAGSMVIAGDGARKVVLYAVTPPREDGHVLLNWVASRRFEDTDAVDRTDWNRPVTAAKFAHLFTRWHVAGTDLVELFEATEHCFEYPMLDRDPLPRWTTGRVTLLGDAAHAMRPMGSNATTQAVVDARALAYCLATEPDAGTALAAYERHRRPVTARIQLANRNLGPEAVLDLAADPLVPPGGLREVCDDYAELAAFDRRSVNTRSPYDIRRARLLGEREPALLAT
ncbi:FAD-dependent monooxygenase [Saccharothrix sp. Mg75]|uniref:FAD-dependent monooxygenase n=1 Tax=Saccharothrix sp. Mg75 TaxID=3445357 RepID=UPI003EE9925A